MYGLSPSPSNRPCGIRLESFIFVLDDSFIGKMTTNNIFEFFKHTILIKIVCETQTKKKCVKTIVLARTQIICLCVTHLVSIHHDLTDIVNYINIFSCYLIWICPFRRTWAYWKRGNEDKKILWYQRWVQNLVRFNYTSKFEDKQDSLHQPYWK